MLNVSIANVELESFSVDTFPRVVIAGSGLVIRLRNETLPPNVPPLIQVKSFTVHCGIMDLIARPRRFKRVELQGLVINIPPGGLKKDSSQNPLSGAASDPNSEIVRKATNRKHPEEAPIVVDESSPMARCFASSRDEKASNRKSLRFTRC